MRPFPSGHHLPVLDGPLPALLGRDRGATRLLLLGSHHDAVVPVGSVLNQLAGFDGPVVVVVGHLHVPKSRRRAAGAFAMPTRRLHASPRRRIVRLTFGASFGGKLLARHGTRRHLVKHIKRDAGGRVETGTSKYSVRRVDRGHVVGGVWPVSAVAASAAGDGDCNVPLPGRNAEAGSTVGIAHGPPLIREGPTSGAASATHLPAAGTL